MRSISTCWLEGPTPYGLYVWGRTAGGRTSVTGRKGTRFNVSPWVRCLSFSTIADPKADGDKRSGLGNQMSLHDPNDLLQKFDQGWRVWNEFRRENEHTRFSLKIPYSANRDLKEYDLSNCHLRGSD